jgi:hypothetical protein
MIHRAPATGLEALSLGSTRILYCASDQDRMSKKVGFLDRDGAAATDRTLDGESSPKNSSRKSKRRFAVRSALYDAHVFASIPPAWVGHHQATDYSQFVRASRSRLSRPRHC